jgi:3-oxoadipate enol-lactonase
MTIPFHESGRGKPVVLLHAFPLSRKMWAAQALALASHECRVICPDLRGFGENHSFSDVTAMEDSAREIAALLDALKIERAVIGGLSMGGYVTFNLYRLFPAKFAALLLCDTSSASDSAEKRQARFELIDNLETRGPQALIDGMLPNLICEYTKQNNPGLVDEITRTFREVNPKAAAAALRGMAGREDHTPLLKDISAPALLIFGAADIITTPEIAEKMRSEIPRSSFVKLKNAGHYSNLEQPEAFNDALLSFINAIEI